ncbi:MAG: Ig-like domain-containing protein [bacterium]
MAELHLKGDLDTATPIGNVVVLSVDDKADPDQGSSVVPYQTEPDSRPPRHLGLAPDGATDLPVTSRFGLVFNEFVSVKSAWAGSIRLYVDGLDRIRRRPGGRTLQRPGEHRETSRPPRPLARGTTYRLEVPAGGIADFNGNRLVRPFTATFTTVGREAPRPDPGAAGEGATTPRDAGRPDVDPDRRADPTPPRPTRGWWTRPPVDATPGDPTARPPPTPPSRWPPSPAPIATPWSATGSSSTGGPPAERRGLRLGSGGRSPGGRRGGPGAVRPARPVPRHPHRHRRRRHPPHRRRPDQRHLAPGPHAPPVGLHPWRWPAGAWPWWSPTPTSSPGWCPTATASSRARPSRRATRRAARPASARASRSPAPTPTSSRSTAPAGP